MNEPDMLDALWKALADPLRRKILQYLSRPEYFCQSQGKTVDGICVQDLAKYLDVPQSTVSRHLAILARSGWVVHDRWKTWHYYRINPAALKAVAAWLEALTPLDRRPSWPAESPQNLPVGPANSPK